MPKKELALLIGEYYRLARLRELLAERRRQASFTTIELSTITEVDALSEEDMSIYACDCGATDCRSCGPLQCYHPCEHSKMPGNCRHSDCPNCDDFVGCVACDDPAQLRCTECGDHYCNGCFESHWQDEHAGTPGESDPADLLEDAGCQPSP